ncbi:conserved hypothetical protein [Ricinus communis]|uniref:RNase H type-1 domain-containing protein n=1 Tax=Ricinus communis TaxID=3988 RepID=B9RSP3_RICCO|nr:conserved hypothetical protein [Ricinus communis]
MALRDSMAWASGFFWTKIVFEGDAAQVIQMAKKVLPIPPKARTIFANIFYLMSNFERVNFYNIPRARNSLANNVSQTMFVP